MDDDAGLQSHRPYQNLIAVPLFPLPSVVLFPGAILPLHIFEERYKAMMRDVLDDQRTIAMALLQPGWEKNYYERPAIEPVVCVGRSISHERLADGTYNLLLQGTTRATIVEEQPRDEQRPYRTARLQPLVELYVSDDELAPHRALLATLLGRGPIAQTTLAKQFREMLARDMPMTAIADIAAFTLIEDVRLKQSLLSEVDVRRRVERTIEAVAEMASAASASIRADLN